MKAAFNLIRGARFHLREQRDGGSPVQVRQACRRTRATLAKQKVGLLLRQPSLQQQHGWQREPHQDREPRRELRDAVRGRAHGQLLAGK